MWGQAHFLQLYIVDCTAHDNPSNNGGGMTNERDVMR